jgi:hypothetical protein
MEIGGGARVLRVSTSLASVAIQAGIPPLREPKKRRGLASVGMTMHSVVRPYVIVAANTGIWFNEEIYHRVRRGHRDRKYR